MTFVDQDRGWAVGALGTILATRDGGRTWRRQRTGGTRVALLGFFSEAHRVPLEMFALQSGEEGYLGFAEILNRRDIELPSARTMPPLRTSHMRPSRQWGPAGAELCMAFSRATGTGSACDPKDLMDDLGSSQRWSGRRTDGGTRRPQDSPMASGGDDDGSGSPRGESSACRI